MSEDDSSDSSDDGMTQKHQDQLTSWILSGIVIGGMWYIGFFELFDPLMPAWGKYVLIAFFFLVGAGYSTERFAEQRATENKAYDD